MNRQEIIKNMSLAEKISFCTGADMWHTKEITRYGVRSVMLADGPHGLRCQTGDTDIFGVHASLPATCFPAAVTSGASWDAELIAEEGEAIGKEARAAGVSVVLGPGCNIKRNPLGGRNFEYFSEDPYIAGKMAASYIRGQQSTGVSSCLKHFAVNSQEYKRQNGDSRVDSRAIREIYLAPFETAVKESAPDTVMCAYNKITGVHASDNKWLLTDVLRDEWGFGGAVITDWGALCSRIEAFRAGCDLNMPGGSPYMEKAAADAVKDGSLDEKLIDASVDRILRLTEKTAESSPVDFGAHHALARRIAEEGAVLLKNDGILPLDEGDIALFGYMAQQTRYQGSGSSHIVPTRLDNITGAFPGAPYLACCDEDGKVTERSLAEAAELAKKRRIAVIVAGLPEHFESEAFDRENMRLPDGHNRMIDAVAEANPNTVVVLLGGGVMEIPWEDKARAILFMGLPGQAAGEAVRNLLTGAACPCGKLTETWPVCYGDVISKETFGVKDPEYRESIYVGYRYYDKANIPVRYPFGHGLSYTEFGYSDLKIESRSVTAKITNTGGVRGAEAVQLYVAPPKDGIFRPEKELKGFARVELEPGETKTVSFELNDRSFAVWDGRWIIPGGTYRVMLGASSRDIRLTGEIREDGPAGEISESERNGWYYSPVGMPPREEWEKLMGHPVPETHVPEKGRFTLDNSCLEMKSESFIMKIQYLVTKILIAKSLGKKRDRTAYKMLLACAADSPLRSLVISSCGRMSENTVAGLLEMANGHFLRGIRAMTSGSGPRA